MVALRSTVTLTEPVGPDPIECHEFGYGLGQRDGILVLRYLPAGALSFGSCRQDFLHQIYWAPDGVLRADRHGRDWYVGGNEALWVRRAVSHEVRAYGRTPIYRICVRQRPTDVAALDQGVVRLSPEAAQAVVSVCRPGVSPKEGLAAREVLFAGVESAAMWREQPADEGGFGLSGRAGPAAAVAAALAYEPGDPSTLADWARRLHVSTKTLQRDFERAYGVSFSRWRTSQRLRLARSLVTSEPVGAVAARVGYRSTSAFIAAYRREFGCSPTQTLTSEAPVALT